MARSVSVVIKSKALGGDIGLSETSDSKSFFELLDLSGLNAEFIKDMAEQGVFHFNKSEYTVVGGVDYGE